MPGENHTDHTKIVVFGATGNAGRLLVSQALERGMTVTAFVRNPDKIEVTHDRCSGGRIPKPSIDTRPTLR